MWKEKKKEKEKKNPVQTQREVPPVGDDLTTIWINKGTIVKETNVNIYYVILSNKYALLQHF